MEPESKSVENSEPESAGLDNSTDIDDSTNTESSEGESPLRIDPIDSEILRRSVTSVTGRPDGGADGGTAGHYRMLDSVLEQAPPPARRLKQPMIFDIFLAVGLLVAVAGFTTGLMRIYITHMAKQSINAHNYKAAIAILKRNQYPEFLLSFGSDPTELLNQALYLDAMTHLEANPDDQTALLQLSRITAGSRFFHLAQDILKAKSPASQIKLDSGATHVASPEEMNTTEGGNETIFKQEGEGEN